jgi:hypothetical protein
VVVVAVMVTLVSSAVAIAAAGDLEPVVLGRRQADD